MFDLVNRRQVLRAGLAGGAASGWLDVLAARAAGAGAPARKYKSCVVLWTTGGLPQTDTFDMKPDAPDKVRGAFQPIPSSVPGVPVCELLPRLAKQMHHLAVVRSMSTGRGVHEQGARAMHNDGLAANPRADKPTLGACVSAALAPADFGLPTYVRIGKDPRNAWDGTAGFLGRPHSPLQVDRAADGLAGFKLPVPEAEFDERLKLFEELERGFAQAQGSHGVRDHQTGYRRAVEFLKAPRLKAYDLAAEPDRVRAAYGRNDWGDGCLLARRLVEIGVPFVEVKWTVPLNANANPWDTHAKNAAACRLGLPVLDAGFASLVDDLRDRGLWDSTLVVCMGEFGRTPVMKRYPSDGRDHFPKAWSLVLGGGGVRPGQVVGATSADGGEVKDRPVSAAEFLATVCRALGIDPDLEFGARTGQKLTPQLDNVQRMSAGAGVRLLAKGAKYLTELVG